MVGLGKRTLSPDFAFLLWKQNYPHRFIDSQVEEILSEKLVPCSSVVRQTRNALCLTMAEVARRLGVTKGTYQKYELFEDKSKIQLGTLRKIAESMDCELIYLFRPKQKLPFSRIIWNELEPAAKSNGMYQMATGERKHRALRGAARRAFDNPSFARSRGWSQKRARPR